MPINRTRQLLVCKFGKFVRFCLGKLRKHRLVVVKRCDTPLFFIVLANLRHLLLVVLILFAQLVIISIAGTLLVPVVLGRSVPDGRVNGCTFGIGRCFRPAFLQQLQVVIVLHFQLDFAVKIPGILFKKFVRFLLLAGKGFFLCFVKGFAFLPAKFGCVILQCLAPLLDDGKDFKNRPGV